MLIAADWYWLILIDAEWCGLMLIDADADWCWLILIYVDWCWRWLILINADWCWLILIGADWCWIIITQLIDTVGTITWLTRIQAPEEPGKYWKTNCEDKWRPKTWWTQPQGGEPRQRSCSPLAKCSINCGGIDCCRASSKNPKWHEIRNVLRAKVIITVLTDKWGPVHLLEMKVIWKSVTCTPAELIITRCLEDEKWHLSKLATQMDKKNFKRNFGV